MLVTQAQAEITTPIFYEEGKKAGRESLAQELADWIQKYLVPKLKEWRIADE